MSNGAFPECIVCGRLLPNGAVMCKACAAAAADRAVYNFNADKALGRRIIAQGLRFPKCFRPLKGISVKKRFPMMFQATALAGKAGTHRSDARERRFERYAKGSRKIAEFFPAVKNRKSS